MAKKKNKSYWNYRILTRKVHVEKGKVKDGDLIVSHKDWREFFITEVYYKKGKPVSYAPDLNPLSGWDSLKSLKWTAKHIKEALKLPVLDINNWPKKWKTE
jgi:hypothetical protein